MGKGNLAYPDKKSGSTVNPIADAIFDPIAGPLGRTHAATVNLPDVLISIINDNFNPESFTDIRAAGTVLEGILKKVQQPVHRIPYMLATYGILGKAKGNVPVVKGVLMILMALKGFGKPCTPGTSVAPPA